MGFWAKLAGLGGNPIKEIGDTIDKLTTSGAEKSAARQKALEVMVQAQATVIEAEAKAGGIAAVWRPLTMLSFGAMLWWYVFSSTFGWPPPDLSAIPPDLWTLMKVGLGGYAGGRSVEKIVSTVVKTKK